MPSLFCPACKATYQDETLVYCLNDGAKLVALGNNSEATVQMSHRTSPMQVNIPKSEPTIIASPPPSLRPAENRKSAGLLIGLLVVGFLAVLAAVGAVGAYFAFVNTGNVATATPTPAVSPSQVNTSPANTSKNANGFDKADILTKELEEKINRLEKQLEAQKQKAQSNSSSSQTQEQSGTATARVNSPNDGFLALRSAPSTETGTQILKIPHGSLVSLNNCEKTTVKIDGRVGRWCDVNYAGKSGWVFSGWLDY